MKDTQIELTDKEKSGIEFLAEAIAENDGLKFNVEEFRNTLASVITGVKLGLSCKVQGVKQQTV